MDKYHKSGYAPSLVMIYDLFRYISGVATIVYQNPV